MSNTQHILSFGAIKRILDGENPENVVLQILGYKQIPGSDNSRFRLLLNDGVVLFPYAILATQLNNFIYDKHLEKFTVFRLKDFEHSQLLSNKKVIICIDIEILIPGSQVKEKISEKTADITRNTNPNELNVSTSTLQTSRSNPVNFEPLPSTSDIPQNWDIAPSNVTVFSQTQDIENVCFSDISSLSPYRNKWTVKARISYKTPLINYCKMQKQGKYFSFHLLDESGEIAAIAFNENAEKFYKLLDIFKIYIISNGIVQPAHENCPIKCDFEITVGNHTKIEPCTDEKPSLPMPMFNFHTIKEIISLPTDSYTDVIGICNQISDVNRIMTKSNREVSKRTISLIDKGKKYINVTLWGVHADNFTVPVNSVIAIKNAKITYFGGRTLCATSLSLIYIDPNIHKTFELRSWFRTVRSYISQSISSVSEQTASENWKSIADVFSYNTNVPFYHTTKATVVMVKQEPCMYQACPTAGCLKKVSDLNNGQYKCYKCDMNYNNFNWVYMLSLKIADFTGSQWVIAFRETAEDLIGLNSNELNKIKNSDEDKYFAILNSLNLKSYIFKLRSNFETFNETTRLKTLLLSFNPVEPVIYTRKLLNDIKRMNRILNN